jgi:hypothetical protein
MSITPAVTTARLDALGRELGALIARNERARGLEEFAEYRDDIERFAAEVLRVKLWSRQLEMVHAVRDHPQVLVLGGNGVGKDFGADVIALHWVIARAGRVLATAAVERQLVDVVMAGIARLLRRAPELPGEVYRLSLRIPGADDAGVLCATANEASKLTGLHAREILCLYSEAQAVPAHALEGLVSCATGPEDRHLAVANPLSPEGWAYEASRSRDWHVIRIPVDEHPNIATGRTVIPGGPSQAFIDRINSIYGPDSPQATARLHAEYPLEHEHAAIPGDAIADAVEAHRTQALASKAAGKPWIIGADPAFTNDEFGVCVWRGPVVEAFHMRRKLHDAAPAVEWLLEIMRELRRPIAYGVPSFDVHGVYIDKIGVGYTMPGLLRDALNRWEWPDTTVHGVNIADKPGDEKRFARRKDELVWALRTDLVERRIAIPDDEKLIEELRELRMHQRPDGRMECEKKEDMKKRLGRSPDRLDALLLGLSPRVPHGKTFLFGAR